MRKKFDFTAEMKEAQITKSTPQNEYLEEEKRLLGINVKELAELNDNVYGLRTDLTALVDLLGKYKLSITQDTQEQAVKFGNTVLGQFIDKTAKTSRFICTFTSIYQLFITQRYEYQVTLFYCRNHLVVCRL